MNLIETFPLMFCLNLARRQDRRFKYEEQFEENDLNVIRFPAIDAKWARNIRGFEQSQRYVHALGFRQILRKARSKKAPAVFIFEDDIEISPDIHSVLDTIQLPENWGMFYLGGMHCERPKVITPRLVRARRILSSHALGVRDIYYNDILRSLNKRGPNDEFVPAADIILSRLHQKIPTYATFPNLIWQREDFSDIEGGEYQPYLENGEQSELREPLEGLIAESLGGQAYPPAREYAAKLRHWSGFGSSRKGLCFELDRKICDNIPVFKPTFSKTPNFIGSKRNTTEIISFLVEGDEEIEWEGYLSEHSTKNHFFRRERLVGIDRIHNRIEMMKDALENTESRFFFLLPSGSLPVRPYHDLELLAKVDGRSRFFWHPRDSTYGNSKEGSFSGILSSYFVQHAPWVFLNREVAELLVEDDFTEYFSTACEDNSWCYEGTILKMKGYPLHSHIARQDLVYLNERRDQDLPSHSDNTIGMIIGSGKFFVTPGISKISKLKLFRRPCNSRHILV